MKITAAILETQPFLKGMSVPHLELLAKESMFAEFKPDERVLVEGSPANRFYLLLEGQIELQSSDHDQEIVHIQKLSAGDVLGWSWLFPPYYWHFDAIALTKVKAIFFYGTHLRELCEDDHDFGYELMRRVSEVVVKRLQFTRNELSEQLSINLMPPELAKEIP